MQASIELVVRVIRIAAPNPDDIDFTTDQPSFAELCLEILVPVIILSVPTYLGYRWFRERRKALDQGKEHLAGLSERSSKE